MIEILRDMKAGIPLTLSTGKGKRARLEPSPALIDLLAAEVRRLATEQLAELDALDLAVTPVREPVLLQADTFALVEPEPVPEPAPVPQQAIRPSEASKLVKAYFEHASDHQLKCWYVTHQLREDLTRTGWEEVSVEAVNRIKVCDLPVYPIHSFMASVGVCVAEGNGWKLIAKPA